MSSEEGAMWTYTLLAAGQTDQLLGSIVLLADTEGQLHLLLLLVLDLLFFLGEAVLEVRHPIRVTVRNFFFFGS